mmetsp:Transcript_41320/g.117361  ORF Transcript_41320/g.117361 Transcript_41320/m.117361 type:complete len:161 (+) Transcript_41320:376-858(+)
MRRNDHVIDIYSTYTSLVAFTLYQWLTRSSPERNPLAHIRQWWSNCRDSRAFQRVRELLTASPSCSGGGQWGAGGAVYDKKNEWATWHDRLVVLGSEAVGEGQMAMITLEACQTTWPCMYVWVWATEPAPYERTRSALMGVLGGYLGGMVWRLERESRDD